jgi:hypothetical protein
LKKGEENDGNEERERKGREERRGSMRCEGSLECWCTILERLPLFRKKESVSERTVFFSFSAYCKKFS